MDNVQDVADVLSSLAKLMGDKPEEVSVTVIPDPLGTVLRLSVASTDVGKLVGKEGRTARALRLIIGAIGMTAKTKFNLDIVQRGDS